MSERSRAGGRGRSGGGEVDKLSVVVVPARDERDRIGRCVTALAEQTVPISEFEVILVADACQDDTEEVAVRIASEHGLKLTILYGCGQGPGPARRLGMGVGADRLSAHGLPHGLIATTDADTRPAPDWLERQLAHLANGVEVIAGDIHLDPAEAAALPPGVLQHRVTEADRRLCAVRAVAPGAEHHHFGGASIGVTAEVYSRVGGLPIVTDLEDEAFARRVLAHGIPIARPADVRVVTAARTVGRARRGLAADLARAVRLSRPPVGGVR